MCGIGAGASGDVTPIPHSFSLAREAPIALETLHVVQRGEHSLRLRWERVPGAHGYRLRWRAEGKRCPGRKLGEE